LLLDSRCAEAKILLKVYLFRRSLGNATKPWTFNKTSKVSTYLCYHYIHLHWEQLTIVCNVLGVFRALTHKQLFHRIRKKRRGVVAATKY